MNINPIRDARVHMLSKMNLTSALPLPVLPGPPWVLLISGSVCLFLAKFTLKGPGKKRVVYRLRESQRELEVISRNLGNTLAGARTSSTTL